MSSRGSCFLPGQEPPLPLLPIHPSQRCPLGAVQAHAESLWQCDFFSKHIITPEGIRQCFVLAFLHVQTRRVIFSPCTFNPNPKWSQMQATAFLEQAKAKELPVDLVMRDHDSNYGAGFDAALEAGGATPHVLQFRSPNTNAYVERFIQSIQQECLDQFIAFGTEHLDLLCREYQTYYETERPHQSMGNRVLVGHRQRQPRQPRLRPLLIWNASRDWAGY